ncbi:MAG: homoserine O-acetyltransferase/O-succinyltransferase family protein [Culicoidibacterales bacterium]
MSPLILHANSPIKDRLAGLGIATKSIISADLPLLNICILNLMPNKIDTELQLLQILGTSTFQIAITFISIESYQSKNTCPHYLQAYYQPFSQIRLNYYDALIITGAPVEQLAFTKVHYWEEFTKILDWSQTNVASTLAICWAAQGALKHFYNIDKIMLPRKRFGVYTHQIVQPQDPILENLPADFNVPHSRHTTSNLQQIKACLALDVLALTQHQEAYLVASTDRRLFCLSGHPEYSIDTLEKEYLRDSKLGLGNRPDNYYHMDKIMFNWQAAATLFYLNWLEYYVVGTKKEV